jgi:hypothetical protein
MAKLLHAQPKNFLHAREETGQEKWRASACTPRKKILARTGPAVLQSGSKQKK